MSATDDTQAQAAASQPGATATRTQTVPGDEHPAANPQHGESPANEEGGTDTRQDNTDVGAPMLRSEGSEPQGPEDALGAGPKRGDYRGRQPEGAIHTHSVAIPEDELETDDDGVVVPGQPLTRMEVQNHHTSNIGDVPGKKGGVETTADDEAETTPDREAV